MVAGSPFPGRTQLRLCFLVVAVGALGSCALPRADAQDPVLPVTTPPIVYVIDYMTEYFAHPETIERLSAAPPDLLHVGKAVPISHLWGPTRLYRGENQYTGGPGHTLSRENIALLTPTVLVERIETIRKALERFHAIGVREVAPYISYHTIAGDHQKREGFWAFYDRWDDYAQWAGAKPKDDPFTWLVVDRTGKFVPGSCGGYSPSYYAPLHRYRACINNPNWAEWHRRLIRMIAEVGHDGCFVDNADSDSCFCEHCKRLFAEFVAGSKDVSWVRRWTRDLRAEQIALDSPKAPSELIRRWRWLRTRDHLGMLRDVGRAVRPGFSIFPNHGDIGSAFIVGARSDRLMFESTFSPGINTAGEPPSSSAVSIEVSSDPVDVEPTTYRYDLRDRTTWMEMQATMSLPSKAQVGKAAPVRVMIKSVGDSLQDGDAAEGFHLILRRMDDHEEVRLDLDPAVAIGGTSSSLKPKQPPMTLHADWTPAKPGRYDVRFGFRYTDDSHSGVRRLPRTDRLGWGRICRSHLPALLFTQHMHARPIYLGYEALGKGWENVQELALAEMAAFGGGGGFSGRGAPQAKYRAFFKKHADLFDGWTQTAPLAVLYAGWGPNGLGTSRFGSDGSIHDILTEAGRLYAALVDLNLPNEPERLSGFEAIYLPSPSYEISEKQLSALQGYVERGGSLVVGGRGVRINDESCERVFGMPANAGERRRGRGVVTLWDPSLPLMPVEPVAATEGRCGNLRFALYRKANQLALHVVNYNVCLLDNGKKVLDVDPTPLRVPLPEGFVVKSVTCFDPDAAPTSVSCETVDGRARLTLPRTHVYRIALFEKE
ncbi:MAG: hypothetical protein JXQ73_02675 [Phycisphaerae bacterium]|nr:hypothetical protein [Phycisphaerae bacterium]